MAERWQTGETRSAAAFWRDSNGAPMPGLTPVGASAYKDGTAGAPAVTVTEVSLGFYRVGFASAPTKDVLVRLDGGASLTTTRYVALEVPVGGYVDLLDTAVSVVASAVTTLLGRLTAARALLLDQLSLLDVAVSTRARPADVQTSVTTTAPPRGELT